MTHSDHPPTLEELDDNLRDRLVAVGKGVVSFIPSLGGPLAEIIGAVIPGQRADRITAYLRNLAGRFEAMESELQRGISKSAQKIDLIEEGGFQAARATTRERIEQIAEAVSRGLAVEEAEVLRRKRLIQLLGELDDDEIALLNAYGKSYGTGDSSAFNSLDIPEPLHLQSSRTEVDRDKLFEAGREHLLRLGLLERKFQPVRRNELPEFDAKTGYFKHRVEISYLGRMLLTEIGLKIPFDVEDDEQAGDVS